MRLLDTDTLSLLFAGHARAVARFEQASDEVATTLISRIEVLQGRFASVMKAADGDGVLRAEQWLQEDEENLVTLPILPFDAAAAAEFDKPRQHKKLKKIGRGDLLIASIALARRATLVTRNLKHFQQVPGLSLENWID